MRRWDRLLDAYMEEYRARGVSRGDGSVHGVSAGSLGSVAKEAAPAGVD